MSTHVQPFSQVPPPVQEAAQTEPSMVATQAPLRQSLELVHAQPECPGQVWASAPPNKRSPCPA
jgi:hypothetical protein